MIDKTGVVDIKISDNPTPVRDIHVVISFVIQDQFPVPPRDRDPFQIRRCLSPGIFPGDDHTEIAGGFSVIRQQVHHPASFR